MTAPLLRVTSESPALKPLEGAYEAWRVHHSTCTRCSVQDWYAPGAPRMYFDPPPEREASLYTKIQANGRPAWLFSFTEPDPAVLCPEGRRLFDTWRRVSIRYASMTPRNSADD